MHPCQWNTLQQLRYRIFFPVLVNQLLDLVLVGTDLLHKFQAGAEPQISSLLGQQPGLSSPRDVNV